MKRIFEQTDWKLEEEESAAFNGVLKPQFVTLFKNHKKKHAD
jgi:hypothetical protein